MTAVAQYFLDFIEAASTVDQEARVLMPQIMQPHLRHASSVSKAIPDLVNVPKALTSLFADKQEPRLTLCPASTILSCQRQLS